MTNVEFEAMLTGGHPNSLGKTVEVVDIVLADRSRLDELYNCYFSLDEVVRLRTSSALKRVCAVHPDWLVPYLDGLLTEIARIDQASTKWTLALLFAALRDRMTSGQHAAATEVMKANLDSSDDWIVQNTTIATLVDWAQSDSGLADWLVPRLDTLSKSSRKSVSARARKALEREWLRRVR